MSARVLAVGIDAPPQRLFHRWLAAGHLPHLAALAREGLWGELHHTKRFRNERCWDLFLTGQRLVRVGARFDPAHYTYTLEPRDDPVLLRPFYALGPPARVATFDLPAPPHPEVHGVQVVGWGSELNATRRCSLPESLFAELVERFGDDPKLELAGPLRLRDESGVERVSWQLPSLYDAAGPEGLRRALRRSVRLRTEILLHLLARGSWDLFLALFPETHTANHLLWHLGEAHPLGASPTCGHAQREILAAVDAAVGRLRAAAGPDCRFAVYTIDDTGPNAMDLPTMAFLPELLWRFGHPATPLLAPGPAGGPVPTRDWPGDRHWKWVVWGETTAAGRALLEGPQVREAAGEDLSWHPAAWYRRLWPRMAAFALPSVADGHVRLNVAGREAAGVVEPEAFATTLDALERTLAACRDPRSGRPLVARTLRTRHTPWEAPEIAPDLIVCWTEDLLADCAEHPALGRIGPLPSFRTGGHRPHGTAIANWFAAAGPAIPRGIRRDGHLVDLPATLLDLAGLAPAAPLAGVSLAAREREVAS